MCVQAAFAGSSRLARESDLTGAGARHKVTI